MAQLSFARLSDDVARGSFSCGNTSIDNMIFESYFATILQHGYAYEILYGKK